MTLPEQKLRDMAEAGIALCRAYCDQRDAVAGTEDRRDKLHYYNQLHVAFAAECHATLQESTGENPSEPVVEMAQEEVFAGLLFDDRDFVLDKQVRESTLAAMRK